jgi:hypothetical protein
MEFDAKAKILSDAWVTIQNVPEWAGFVKWGSLGLAYAFGYTLNQVTLSDEAKGIVEQAYEMFLTVLELPDVEYESLSAVFDAAVANGAKVADVTPDPL